MKENVVPLIPIGLGELLNKHSQDVLVDIACYSPEGVDVFIGWLQTAKERLVSKKQ